MSLGSTEANKTAVRLGLAVAFESRLPVEHELSSRRLIELPFSDLQVRRDLYLVTLKGKRHSPAAGAFIALARAHQHAVQRGDVYAI
jgi:DNA-binding transcriptional LysR family regulator